MGLFDPFAKLDTVLKKIESTDPVAAVEGALQKFEDRLDETVKRAEGVGRAVAEPVQAGDDPSGTSVDETEQR